MTNQTAEILKLYDGDVWVRFTHAGHRYQISVDQGKTWEKKEGVTGVIGKVITKDGLIPWAAGLAAQTFLEALEAYEAENGSLDGVDLDELAQVARMAHTTKRDAGADIGSEVHLLIKAFLEAEMAKC